MKIKNTFLIIPILLVGLFTYSYYYYMNTKENIPSQVLKHNETNINIDKIRFVYKISIFTQKALNTYMHAILIKDENKIDKTLEYLDASVAFMYIEFTKNKDIIETIEPKINEMISLIEQNKLDINTEQLTQLYDINEQISYFVMGKEAKIWRNEHTKYTQSVAQKLENIALYKSLLISFVGLLLIFGLLFWLQIMLHRKYTKQQDVISIQAKNAALGEMISNIAHQWRQPLSIISSEASGMKVHIDFGSFEEKDAVRVADNIVEQCKYLSHTIDDFRNYFKTDTKIKQTCNIKDLVLTSENLVQANFKSHFITLENDLEDCYANINDSLFIQSLINIFNNAKDALSNLDEDTQPYIFVKLYQQKETIHLKIYDNAGGIDPAIINKIFEPYFTTKHQSVGTGIGLYMTLQSIQKHMNGTINVQNISYSYNKNNYTGAQFTIILPSTQPQNNS